MFVRFLCLAGSRSGGCVDSGVSVREDESRLCGGLLIVLDKALRFGCLIRGEVVSPAIADRLVKKLDR